ncbi:putative LOC395778-like protein [Naja naja]|nr:putative LOC395778-like protein [Naja naja]
MEAALGPRELLGLMAGLLLLPPSLFAPNPTAAFSRVVSQENIKIKVNIPETTGDIQERQVVLNITYVNGQVYVNDFPMKSGVTRIKCQTLILKSGNHDTLGIVSVRIMIHEWPLASSSNLQLIVVQEEVTDIDEKQVKQDEVIEIDLLVKDQQVLRHTNYTVPLEENVESPLQTTSHYLLRQVETTVDEQTMPGKLPETPLRTEPPSSYKVMCQWVEDLRKELCTFWLNSFPVFFNFMEVIVVGVVGATLIIKVLKVFCPSCETRGILQLDAHVIPVAAISLLPATPEKINNIEEKCI